MSWKVLFAIYGALPNGNQADAQGFIVTKALQRLIDNTGGIVAINNTSFKDPAVDFTKHFGAVVERDGVQRCFACHFQQADAMGIAVRHSPRMTAITVAAPAACSARAPLPSPHAPAACRHAPRAAVQSRADRRDDRGAG
jgi:hypothetical protein